MKLLILKNINKKHFPVNTVAWMSTLSWPFALTSSYMGFPCGSAGKESACRRPGFAPWVGKKHWRREGLPTPVFWPGELQGLWSPEVAKSQTRLIDFHFHPTWKYLSTRSPCLTIHLTSACYQGSPLCSSPPTLVLPTLWDAPSSEFAPRMRKSWSPFLRT